MNFKSIINNLKNEKNYRKLKVIVDENKINLLGNDYLGISKNKNFKEEFLDKIKDDDNIFSANSSRLLNGNHTYYEELEDKLNFYYKKYSLIYNSGYHLNIGVLPAITTKKDLILSDKLVHSSLIDGFKLSDAKIVRYKHLDYIQLEEYLKIHRNNFENIFIVSESVFSMDGDIVDLKKLVDIKQKYNCILYLDEAHSVGVYGKKGLGICEKENLIKEIDIIVGTFGKAFSSIGAYIMCNENLKNILVNKSRSFIYTTALPPINISWTSFVFDKIITMENERNYLHQISNDLKATLTK